MFVDPLLIDLKTRSRHFYHGMSDYMTQNPDF